MPARTATSGHTPTTQHTTIRELSNSLHKGVSRSSRSRMVIPYLRHHFVCVAQRRAGRERQNNNAAASAMPSKHEAGLLARASPQSENRPTRGLPRLHVLSHMGSFRLEVSVYKRIITGGARERRRRRQPKAKKQQHRKQRSQRARREVVVIVVAVGYCEGGHGPSGARHQMVFLDFGIAFCSPANASRNVQKLNIDHHAARTPPRTVTTNTSRRTISKHVCPFPSPPVCINNIKGI